MKSVLATLALVMVSSAAFANDGGIAAIKVGQIKMREETIRNSYGDKKVIRKIAKPHFVLTIEGGEANKLQKILPSQVSVITTMHPELTAAYNESFKSLGIYSSKSDEASGKVVTINCNDANLSDEGDKITKTGKSVCTLTIDGVDSDDQATDGFGDTQPFEPKVCQ